MRRVQLVLLIVLLLDLLIVLRFADAQPKLPRLGILLTGSPASTAQAPQLDALTRSLAERGWIDGQTLVVDGRWAERPDQLPGLAAELVQSNVSVILSPGPEATRAAAAATSTIPIVMIASTDPQQFGVASLARPGGNLTGLTIGQVEAFFDKRLELLKEAIPGLSRVVVVWDVNRIRAGGDAATVMVGPARALSLQLQHVDVKRVEDFEAAFNAARAGRAGAMLLVESPRAVANHTRIAELGLKNRLPLMSNFAQTVGGRRPDVVWPRPGRSLPTGRHLRGQDPQGRQAGRAPHRAADPVPARPEHEDSEGAGPHHPAVVSAAR